MTSIACIGSSSSRLSCLAVLATILTLVGCSSPGDGAPGPRVDGAMIGVDGAHEHGVVRIGLAVDGRRLSLDLEAPASTVFGFEHAPSTEDEWKIVSDALANVRARVGEVIVVPSELSCRLDDVDVLEAPGSDVHEHADTAEEAEHDEEDHDAAHAHDEHEDSAEDDHGHSEVRVAATWDCAESPEGSEANLRLSELWPEAMLVDLTVITSEGQAGGRVPADAAFRF